MKDGDTSLCQHTGRHSTRRKAKMSEINSVTLHIQKAGKQKFKKPHVISSMSHMEKRVDCTCIYVLSVSSKGSGETA